MTPSPLHAGRTAGRDARRRHLVKLIANRWRLEQLLSCPSDTLIASEFSAGGPELLEVLEVLPGATWCTWPRPGDPDAEWNYLQELDTSADGAGVEGDSGAS